VTTFVKTINGFCFRVRRNTNDLFVLKENLKQRTYLRRIRLEKTDVWLDVGANIGAFAVSIAREVKHVHCYEPDRGNFDLLLQNLTLNKVSNVTAHRAAIVPGNETTIEFFLTKGRNKGSHSLYAKRGREKVIVPSMGIANVLRSVHPTKIKIDAEGVEADLILAANLDRIREVVFEYHRLLAKNKGTTFAKVLAKLDKHFPTVVCNRRSAAWFQVVWAGN
jgi:FkbM family methyltransferase